MIQITRVPYMTTSSLDEIFGSDHFSDDFKTVRVHALHGDTAPKSLDNMGEHVVYVMNRGIIALCVGNPKSGGMNWGKVGYEAAGRAAGIVGVLATAAISAIAQGSKESQVKKALEHPLSFFFSYTDIVSIDIVKFGGFFGKLKDVVIALRTEDAGGKQRQFWIQAKNDDESWGQVFCIMKFMDEAANCASDYLTHATNSTMHAQVLMGRHPKPVNESEEIQLRERINQELRDYITQKMSELNISDSDLQAECRRHLKRYKGLVSDGIYSQAMG